MDFEGIFFNTSDYELTSQNLGEGALGTLFIVEKIKDKSKYTAKIINSQKVFTGDDQMRLMRQSVILQKLNHPAITKFYGINFHSFNDQTLLQPTILTEFLPQGSIQQIFDKLRQNQAINEWNGTKKMICLLGISSAMKCLHQKSIFNHFLKPNNVLIDEKFYPRISDFYYPHSFSKNQKVEELFYMAPEKLEGKDIFGPGTDVYSFAILAYEIITGKVPYVIENDSTTVSEFIEKVKSGDRPILDDSISESMKDILLKCWCQKADERPSFDDIFEKLSTDFSILNEDVDKEEIEKYLKCLENSSINESPKDDKNDAESVKELKKIIASHKRINEYYMEMFSVLTESDDNLQNVYIKSFGGNILFPACRSGNLKLVKFFMSFDKINITEKNVFFIFHDL